MVASNTDLDGPVVNKEAIQLLESFASAVRFVESDIGDAATNRVGAINEVDSLDGSNGLDKIFLARERVSFIGGRESSIHHLRESEPDPAQY
ncbi:hypothetical protein E5D57_008997 [Metarhizium anisopliae]|nr:hypothetical protein E5D57_008997 [Metarhizium anisopliae]